MENSLGKIQIDDKVYFAELQTNLKDVFNLKILEFEYTGRIKIDICIGFFENFGEITLIAGTIGSASVGGLKIHSFKFEYLIKGVHFLKIEDIKANIVNFESEILKKVFTDSILDFEGNHKELSLKPIKLVNSSRIKVNYYNGKRTSWERKLKYAVTQYKYLNVKHLGGAINIWDLCRLLDRIKDLFYLIGFSDEESDIYTFVYYNGRIKQYFELFGWNYNIKPSRFTYFKTYNLNFLELISPNSIYEWIFNEEYQKLFKLLFEKHFLKVHHRELSFINSVYVLERFHRKFIAEKSSFDKRIKYFRQLFEQLLPERIDVNQYLNKIEQTRHNISHFEDKINVFKGIDLYYASLYIEIVIVISILEKIGIKSEQIISLTTFSKEHIDGMYLHNKNLEYTFPSELFR